MRLSLGEARDQLLRTLPDRSVKFVPLVESEIGNGFANPNVVWDLCMTVGNSLETDELWPFTMGVQAELFESEWDAPYEILSKNEKQVRDFCLQPNRYFNPSEFVSKKMATERFSSFDLTDVLVILYELRSHSVSAKSRSRAVLQLKEFAAVDPDQSRLLTNIKSIVGAKFT